MATSDDSGTYIGNATTSIPADTAGRYKGAAEIRKVKSQLAATFPNFVGAAVSATEAELNYLDITTLGTAAASKALVADGSAQIDAGAITFTDLGTVTTADINGGTWQGTIDGTWTASGQTCTHLGTVSDADFTKLTIGGSAELTAVDTDLSSVAVTDTTLASAKAIKAYVDTRPFWDFEAEILPPLATSTYHYSAHGLGAVPSLVEVVAKCTTAVSDFSVGEEYVLASEHYFTRVQIIKDATNVGVYLASDWYLRSTTGTQLSIDTSPGKDNFSLILRAKV